MINETNYHVYLDDFINGLLDEELEMEFVAFLDKHPGILEDESLDQFEARLPDTFKSGLKKQIPIAERANDEMLIASMEGDLTVQEEKELSAYIAATPALQRDQSLLALTRLEADLSIQYPDKKGLMKRPVYILYTRWASAVAAVFILGMMIFRFSGTGVEPNNPHVTTLPQTQLPKEVQADNPAVVAEKQDGTILQQVKNQKNTEGERQEPGMRNTRELPISLPNRNLTIEMPEMKAQEYLATLEENIGSGPTAASGEQSVWQWAYKKVRGRIGEAEIIIPEKEIPRDVANIVLAKVAPVFEYDQDGDYSSIRIAGIEFQRRTKQ